MKKLLADIQLAPPGGFQGTGPLGNPGNNAPAIFNATLSKVIGIITVVGFIWFTFQVILGALRIVGSAGDKGAIEGARKQITSGVIGVIVIVAAIFIVKLVGTILGLNNILNPTCIINNSC